MKSLKRISYTVAIITIVASPVLGQGKPVIPSTSPVEANLVIPDMKLLPGVPFELWISLRNTSAATVGVGLCADMVVRPEGGEPFTVVGGGLGLPPYPALLADRKGSNAGAVRYLLMKPKDAVTLALPMVRELEGPIYFADERLSKPGRYGISLRLDYCWGGNVPQKSLLPVEFLGAVTTNEIVVERITPAGSDAVVWQRMQEKTNGKWIPTRWRPEVTTEILTKHSDSNYYPYALLAASFGRMTQDRLNRLLDAIERFPESPVIEWLQVEAWESAIGARAQSAGALFNKVKQSKRPTTRMRVFGREDVAEEPCPPEYDCEN
ncbi:MAG TPA: hypothetical protein VNL91_09895 [Thermoanaerobaculia bacterium]|nr:hypothetical protein [Thermoanaerobaculia bacterium]